jgi:hypothetical protein
VKEQSLFQVTRNLANPPFLITTSSSSSCPGFLELARESTRFRKNGRVRSCNKHQTEEERRNAQGKSLASTSFESGSLGRCPLPPSNRETWKQASHRRRRTQDPCLGPLLAPIQLPGSRTRSRLFTGGFVPQASPNPLFAACNALATK